MYSPRRYHIDSTTVVVHHATQGVHDPSDAPFGALVLDSARAVEESGSGADESEACVFLVGLRGSFGAILLDESVQSQFGRVEGAVEVYVDCFEVWRLGWVFGAWLFWHA
jgi:hypothetical protein